MFADTSVLYAACDEGDGDHSRALELLDVEEPLLITDLILAECWLLISRRISFSAGETFWDRIRSGLATVEIITAGDLEVAWQIGQRFIDQTFSLVDRTSFAVMERKGVNSALSFDSDFSIYRYGAGGKRAFEVLR